MTKINWSREIYNLESKAEIFQKRLFGKCNEWTSFWVVEKLMYLKATYSIISNSIEAKTPAKLRYSLITYELPNEWGKRFP